jgi:CheY-like chemotaxis protein
MDPETMKRIFDPYFTTKPVGDGTGLGLAVVHGIVQSHKGAIRVESQLGRGSSFQICFPCHESPAFEVVVENAEPPRGKERILFVDDEAAITEVTRRTLEKLGYTVVAKTSSLEALAAFQQSPHTFDLVITDQTMPDLTGIMLAGQIKKIRPRLPIILCTGFSEDATPEKSLLTGISAHLYKPFGLADLAKTIQKVLIKSEAG